MWQLFRQRHTRCTISKAGRCAAASAGRTGYEAPALALEPQPELQCGAHVAAIRGLVHRALHPRHIPDLHMLGSVSWGKGQG